MKALHRIAAAALLSGLVVALALGFAMSSAAALDEQQQAQLGALLEGASDVSGGTRVGQAKITAWDGRLLRGEAACEFSRILNADEVCTTEAIVFPPRSSGIDSIYYGTPEEIGYVDMSEWTDDATAQIDAIWQDFVAASKAQSARIGFEVTPLKWVLYPTLDKQAKVMTYGFLMDFGGEQVINLHAVRFTRSGYVELGIVTDYGMLGASGRSFAEVAAYAAKTYRPASGFRYADFKDGDKVAAIGAVGVLAAVLGAQSGKKGPLAVIAAAIAAFFKKLWFLLLAIPAAIWGAVRRVFRGGGDDI